MYVGNCGMEGKHVKDMVCWNLDNLKHLNLSIYMGL